MSSCRTLEGLNGKMCGLLHTSLVVQKMQRGQKKPVELAIIWVRVMSGTEKAPAIDGQGKLAERNETSSSALPALQHPLGGLRAEHPLVALPRNLLVEPRHQ